MRMRILSMAFCLFLVDSAAHADCTPDFRRVELDGTNVVRLRSFDCQASPGTNNPQIKLEFHRLSDAVASAMFSGALPSSLKNAIGSPKLIGNEVSKTYSDLLGQFGTTIDTRDFDVGLSVTGAGGGGTAVGSIDSFGTGILRVLVQSSRNIPTDMYPAVNEIMTLRRKRIPSSMKYYYSILCQDNPDSPFAVGSSCQKYFQEPMTFWRPMRAEDFDNFSHNLNAYNQHLRGQATPIELATPRHLRLARHLAGDNWPDDFLIMTGSFQGEGCWAGGWTFGYSMRGIIVDAIRIENVSSQSVSIDGLLQSISTDTHLRSSPAPIVSEKKLRPLTETLSPGQSLVVLTKITLVPAQRTLRTFSYRQTSIQINKRLGSNGFEGEATYGAPAFKNYIFGPEVAVAGLSLNGQRLDLAKYSANFIDLAVTYQEGSCPYLVSRGPLERDWVENGKVLHNASGKRNEQNETRVFKGFRTHFRLEEREPEVAMINKVELSLVLRNGRTSILRPHDQKLQAQDQEYVMLDWGQGLDIQFDIPDNVTEQEVVESRLSITGYYISQSQLGAQGSEKLQIQNRSLIRRINGASNAPLFYSQACPVSTVR